MKVTFAVTLMLGAALALAACGGGAGPDAAPSPTSATIQTATPDSGTTPYPKEVTWEQAPALLATGEVSSVMMPHFGPILILMTDGSREELQRTAFGNIFKLIEECGDPCKEMPFAME